MANHRIDYILKSEKDDESPPQSKMREILHGTPCMLKSWLEYLPDSISEYFVRDTEAGVIVTARRYLEQLTMYSS
jgi:hypothetical protein